MDVAMVDPSAFTLPYDNALCSALSTVSHDVRLVTSADTSIASDGYTLSSWYYQYTNRMFNDRSRVRLMAKGFEHLIDTSRTLARLQQLDPDVIHFQWLPIPAFDRLATVAFRRIAPVVLTVHDTTPFHGDSSSLLQLLGARSAPKAFDHIIVHTDYSRRQLWDSGVDDIEISVIPHGVFEYPLNGLPSKLEPRDDRSLRVLLFGTLKPYKRIDVLLRAVAALPASLRDQTELVIAGEPRMEIESLFKLVSALGIEDIVTWYPERVAEKHVGALFDSADVVTFPYDDIDQSGALMAALPHSVPILATNVGGFPEIIEDGLHGRLVSPNDPSALAAALEMLLSNPDKRLKMGQAVEELASSVHAWERIAGQTTEVYESVIP